MSVIRLRVGAVVFDVEREILLRVKNTYFHGLLSGAWQPDSDGAFYIDRPPIGFERILEYLSSGKLRVEGLSDLEIECLYSNLDYFLIPYIIHWNYNTQSVIKRFRARYIIELNDGRLCGAQRQSVVVWNMDCCAKAMTLKGHIDDVNQILQLEDGRLCSCSDDRTIKLWSLEDGVCERTLTGHTSEVICVMQLFDGRLCSLSWDNDETIKVWNVSECVCEMTLITAHSVESIVQLSDGRICCTGDSDGFISIYCLSTGECVRSWQGEGGAFGAFAAIVCIDSTRICSRSNYKNTLKVWNTATGECERTLEGHTGSVTSMVLMQDGRLCSASHDGALKVWNLDTGECEKTLGNTRGRSYHNSVMQLSDGRLVSCSDSRVCIWS